MYISEIYSRAMIIIEDIQGFQWDKGNILKNMEKHRVSNSECEEIFFNHPLIVADDEQHSGIEKRYFALGKTTDGRRLFVVFTIRQETIRVISARDMSKKERNIYEKQEDADSRIQE